MPDYLAELERLWRQNVINTILKFPVSRSLRRSKTLRGPDLCQELMRLAVMTRDMRFGDALLALIEHRIVSRNFNFLPSHLPPVPQKQEKIQREACVVIHQMKSRGASLRRACAELAAHMGWPAASLAAATKQLELLYRQHPEFIDPATYRESRELLDLAELRELLIGVIRSGGAAMATDLTTELEESCSTSIPTTASD
jgi:hypothetical protein